MIAEALELHGYTLLDPWLLLFAPAFVAIAVRCRLRQPAALPSAHTGMLQGLPRTLRARCVHLPLWITLLGGVCLALALARPVRREVVPQRQEGIDIALVLDRGVTAADVIGVVEGAGISVFDGASIFDVYEGDGVGVGKKSLGLTLTWRAADRTLTDDEVATAQALVLERLSATLGATLR